MSNYDSNETIDHMADNPWATASGLPSWQDDYTRFRDGEVTYSGTAFSGIDMSVHKADNYPTDVFIGRLDGHTGRELDKGKY
jgi:hypothetical protein